MPASFGYHGRRQQWPFRGAGRQLCLPAVTTLPTKTGGRRLVFSDPATARHGDSLDRRSDDAAIHPGRDWASASPVTATPAVNGIWRGAL